MTRASHVIDEMGVQHLRCHGVSAEEWFRTIHQVIIMLTSPEQRAQHGLIKLGPVGKERCEDPDCKRLNRRSHEEPNAFARYKITKSLTPVAPVNPGNVRERMLCAGHPYEVGGFICDNCARVAMAKRFINARQVRQ